MILLEFEGNLSMHIRVYSNSNRSQIQIMFKCSIYLNFLNKFSYRSKTLEYHFNSLYIHILTSEVPQVETK